MRVKCIDNYGYYDLEVGKEYEADIFYEENGDDDDERINITSQDFSYNIFPFRLFVQA